MVAEADVGTMFQKKTGPEGVVVLACVEQRTGTWIGKHQFE